MAEVRTIKLRAPCEGKVLGIDLDASLHEIEASVEDGILTIHAGQRVWDAMRRLSMGMVKAVEREKPKVKTVDELAKPVLKTVEKTIKTDSKPLKVADDNVEIALAE